MSDKDWKFEKNERVDYEKFLKMPESTIKQWKSTSLELGI